MIFNSIRACLYICIFHLYLILILILIFYLFNCVCVEALRHIFAVNIDITFYKWWKLIVIAFNNFGTINF